jgi:arylsulfatase A-like enzyme
VAAVAMAAAALALPSRVSARPPNVVYFIIDELGYYELSCMGHPEHRTPYADELAKQGVMFTQCLAGGPVCAPTRCSLLTGKHAGHMTIRANGGFDPLRPEEQTIGSMLKTAGYAVGGFGKWGNGARGTTGVPEKHGFDVFFGYYDQVHAHTYFPKYLIRNSEEVVLPGNDGNPTQGQTYSQYRIFEEGKKFIRENKDRPFFAYMCWTPPHGLWGMPKDDPSWKLYADKPYPPGGNTKDDVKIYAAMVNLVDREMGEVRAMLKELGIDKDTIVVFTGDNGGLDYFRDKDHPEGFFSPNVDPKTGRKFRGFKASLYEGGLRVPYIVYWPGKIEGGRVSDHLCYFVDVMPTLAELCGAECPKEADGVSFAPELLGQHDKQKQHDYLYWEHRNQAAVRIGDWKGVRTGEKWELFNLKDDVSEEKDLAGQHPDIVAKMKAIAAEAHTPVRLGEVLDRDLVQKDRNYYRGGQWPKKGKANDFR